MYNRMGDRIVSVMSRTQEKSVLCTRDSFDAEEECRKNLGKNKTLPLSGLAPPNLVFGNINFEIKVIFANISTMVGELYRAGDPRRDAGFSLFYAGINLGALFGGGLCVYVGKTYSWNMAFALSGIFMMVGLINFQLIIQLMKIVL